MLRQSNQELGQTVLMITHNPEAAEYGDEIIHMRDGEIVAPEQDPSGRAITEDGGRNVCWWHLRAAGQSSSEPRNNGRSFYVVTLVVCRSESGRL